MCYDLFRRLAPTKRALMPTFPKIQRLGEHTGFHKGAHVWAKCLKGPQWPVRGGNREWLLNPYRLGVPQRPAQGGNQLCNTHEGRDILSYNGGCNFESTSKRQPYKGPHLGEEGRCTCSLKQEVNKCQTQPTPHVRCTGLSRKVFLPCRNRKSATMTPWFERNSHITRF